MNQKTKKWMIAFSFSVFIILLMYSFFIIYIFIHEAVHQEIYRSYGIESRIELDYLRLGGATIISGEDSLKCNEYCNLAHNLNEVVGYPLGLIYIMLIGIFILLVIKNVYRENYNF